MQLWKVYEVNDNGEIYYRVAPYDFKQYIKWYGFEFDGIYLSRKKAERIAAKRNKKMEELNNDSTRT